MNKQIVEIDSEPTCPLHGGLAQNMQSELHGDISIDIPAGYYCPLCEADRAESDPVDVDGDIPF